MIALKTFINAKQQRINVGDTVNQEDYDKLTWENYLRRGLIGDNKQAKPKNNKQAKPKQNK